jgi:biotin transport system substrate-specific component
LVDVTPFLWHLVRMKSMTLVQSRDSLLSRFAWVTFFALLTGVASWVRIPLPFTPVPVTLQTMVVLSCGIVLGRDGLYAQVLYLLLGGVGLPMFASHGTHSALFGPTGGYLVGFVAASYLTGVWIQPKWNQTSYFGRALQIGFISFLILAIGTLFLSIWMGVSISQALALGFVPFVVGEGFKVLAVAGIPTRRSR